MRSYRRPVITRPSFSILPPDRVGSLVNIAKWRAGTRFLKIWKNKVVTRAMKLKLFF